MIVAGCDVGSLTAKAVIMNGSILGHAVIKAKSKPEESAAEVMDQALTKAGLKMEDIAFCVGTGYGRNKIPFVNMTMSEIACHGKGAQWIMPSVRTVIDIGGQDCKVMRLDRDGNILKFSTNDKCAAGTGRFLEVMAKLLGVSLDELGTISENAKDPLSLSATCTVWVQAEVIHHLNYKNPLKILPPPSIGPWPFALPFWPIMSVRKRTFACPEELPKTKEWFPIWNRFWGSRLKS